MTADIELKSMRLPKPLSKFRKQVSDYSATILSMVRETVFLVQRNNIVLLSCFKIHLQGQHWPMRITVTRNTKAFASKEMSCHMHTKSICAITRTETKTNKKNRKHLRICSNDYRMLRESTGLIFLKG